MNPIAVEEMAPERVEARAAAHHKPSPRATHYVTRTLFAVVGLAMLLTVLLGLVQKWLWMRQLDYVGIFWTLLSVKWGMFGVALVCGLLFLWLNLRIAARNIGGPKVDRHLSRGVSASADTDSRLAIVLSRRLMVLAISVAILFVSLIFAVSVSSQWDTYLRFHYGGSFGVTDPLFGIDLGFYFSPSPVLRTTAG